MKHPISTLLAATVALLAFGATALAAPPMEGLPKKSEVLMGLNIKASRGTLAFKELVKLARNNQDVAEVIENIKKDAGLDLEKDLDYVVMAFPSAKATNRPSAANVPFTAVARGTFDRAKIEKVLADAQQKDKVETEKLGKFSVYVIDHTTFGFLDDDTMLFSVGPTGYRQTVWKNAHKKSRSISQNKTLQNLLGEVDPAKSFWLVADTTSLNPPKAVAPSKKKTKGKSKAGDPQPEEPPADPRMDSISLTVDLSAGLTLDALAHLASEDDARVAQEGLQKDLKAASDNFLVKMMGAGPLLANMKLDQAKSDLKISTSMNKGEFSTMLKALVQAASDPRMPQPGAAPKAAPGTPADK